MRLILVGAGSIAAEVAGCALLQGHAVVGVVDVDPAKIGRDGGEVLGVEPLGVAVVADVEEVAEAADIAVVATGSALAAVAGELRACLRHGLDVISTCEELAYPWRTRPELAAALDADARAHGVTLLGAGINPGFVMDMLVLAASVPCWMVRRVRVRRVLDAATRRASFRQKVGAGLPAAEVRSRLDQGTLGHVGLAESAWFLGDRLGLGGRKIEETIEPVVGPDGLGAGLRQRVVLHGEAEEVVRLEMEMVVGATDPRDEIELDSRPPVRLVVPGGLPGDAGTAGVVVNAARRVREAPPGLLTMDQLPLGYPAPRAIPISAAR